MSGNSFGKILKMTTFGESHGEALGVVVEGVPSKLTFCLEELQSMLDRRAPGQKGTTPRKEKDRAEVLSGIFEGKTLGTPIAVIIHNENQRSADYTKDLYRIGHADKTTEVKYGIRDHRGGGRSSGRETVSRVIGGYFAGLILPQVEFSHQILNMGELQNLSLPLDEHSISYLQDLRVKGESVGGRVQLTIKNVPASLGEPVFDKLKADLAKAVMSIGAITSFSYGRGEQFATLTGSECSTKQSYFGGMEGGISNGEELLITFTVKPTSTVGEKAKAGRHDPCIIPRVIPIVESMVHFVLADHYLRQKIYE